MEQLRTDVLDIVAKFPVSESIGGAALKDSEQIAQLIVNARSDDPYRQRVAHIADAFADVIPDIRNLPGARAVLKSDEDRGHAGTRETAQEVESWRFLQRAFEPLGDLFEHVVDTGAR